MLEILMKKVDTSTDARLARLRLAASTGHPFLGPYAQRKMAEFHTDAAQREREERERALQFSGGRLIANEALSTLVRRPA